MLSGLEHSPIKSIFPRPSDVTTTNGKVANQLLQFKMVAEQEKDMDVISVESSDGSTSASGKTGHGKAMSMSSLTCSSRLSDTEWEAIVSKVPMWRRKPPLPKGKPPAEVGRGPGSEPVRRLQLPRPKKRDPVHPSSSNMKKPKTTSFVKPSRTYRPSRVGGPLWQRNFGWKKSGEGSKGNRFKK